MYFWKEKLWVHNSISKTNIVSFKVYLFDLGLIPVSEKLVL